MAANDDKLKLSTLLYVGDLHPDVTEKDLFETFSRDGPLLSVHLCRDKFSPDYKSLCYGFVDFWLPCHASDALERLNHTPLKGKSIRIMWHESDPTARMDNNANLFVKNIDKSITSGRLQELFSKYGTILSCKVSEENGISKGFGFVQFDSVNSAIAARSALHDSFLEGKKLYVSKFIRKSERNYANVGFKSLFVKNLDQGITTDVLKDEFSKYGKVRNAVIMKDEKGKSKGFGFLNFHSHEAAARAMKFLNGELLGSKKIFVARAVKKSEPIKNFIQMPGYACPYSCKELKASNMFAKNLHGSVAGQNFGKLFSGYGTVNYGKPIWNNGVSRHFSYSFFPGPYNNNKALNSVAGANSEGKRLNMAVAKPQPSYPSNSQPLCSNFPYFGSLIQPNSLQSIAYQCFDGSSNSSYSISAQNIQGPFKAMRIGYKQEGYLEMVKDQEPSSPVNLSNNGHVKEFSKGSRTTKTLRTRQGCVLKPHVKNIQRGSDSWRRVLKSPEMDENTH